MSKKSAKGLGNFGLKVNYFLAVGLFAVVLSACSHKPLVDKNMGSQPAPIGLTEGSNSQGLSGAGPALVAEPGLKGTPNLSGRSYVVKGRRYHILATADGFEEKGLATWYGPGFHGRKTANGEIFDVNKITAAHKTLPMGSMVEVTNLDNNEKIVVRINDRGPFATKKHIIDLSKKAARSIGVLGVSPVSIRVVSPTDELEKK